MAAFSYQNQYPPSLIDLSLLFPNSSINSISSCLPDISSCEPLQEIQQKTDSSSIVEASSDQGTQMMTTMGMKRKNRDGSCLSSIETKDSKRGRGKKQNSCSEAENKMKVKKEPKPVQTGYVHVRARRGEATDSHSLAERVRRERISEKLKMLQSLVPGCDKVTSKALMLDEIINYVQALQHQVEFLSMKLASTGPMLYDLSGQNMSSIVKPEKLSIMASPLPQAQQSLLPQPDITTSANNYPLIDSSVSYLLQQEGERPIDFYQQENDVNVLWSTIDEHRQRLCNQSYFPNLS